MHGARILAWLLSLTVALGPVTTSRFIQTDERPAAIQRALGFIYSVASDQAVFAAHGDDLLWCFFSIANTAKDPELRKQAAKMGHELAETWHRGHPHIPANADAEELTQLVMGAYAAERLGVKDGQIKAELRKAAARFTARDYLRFDAPNEPPDLNDPDRYTKWMDALIRTFFGDAYGIKLGAHYRDVVKWLPRLRPYLENDDSLEFDEFYAITHLIYTLDRYGERRVSPSFLTEEVGFLKRRMAEAMADDDPEMVGEGWIVSKCSVLKMMRWFCRGSSTCCRINIRTEHGREGRTTSIRPTTPPGLGLMGCAIIVSGAK